MKFILKAEITSTIDPNEKIISDVFVEADNLEEAFKIATSKFNNKKYNLKWIDGKEVTNE